MSWNGFGADPHLNFERKLKMMLHPLHILALTFCSKFQFIQVIESCDSLVRFTASSTAFLFCFLTSSLERIRGLENERGLLYL